VGCVPALPHFFEGVKMAISKTEILNKALTLLGAATITDIDDQSNNARQLSRVYETSLRSVLSETKWNFATKRNILSLVVDPPDWTDPGEIYVYQKPADVIRIFGMSDSTATWREEGDYIYSDTQNLGMRYTYYLDEPSKYPSFFVDAFVDKLAMDVSYAIINSDTMASRFAQSYNMVSLPRAISANAQTGVQQQTNDDAWEIAKYYNNQVNA
jgi:hypothetical protein